MKLLFVIVSGLLTSGVFLVLLRAIAGTAFAAKYRQRQDRPSRVAPDVYRRNVITTAIISPIIFLSLPFALQSYLIAPTNPGVWRVLGEAAGILLAHDFLYYLMHRFIFHGSAMGRRIHSVHHSVRTPYVMDAFYLHPAEVTGGIVLFLICVMLVGPVGIWSFAIAFFLYTLENLYTHSGLHLPFFPGTALVRNHDRHHDSMKAGYYAVTTPLWDIVFRTTRAKEVPAPVPVSA